MKNFSAWVIAPYGPKDTSKTFSMQIFFEDGTGHPSWVIMAENGIFSEEWANMRDPSGTC
jgi:hypothetical protein